MLDIFVDADGCPVKDEIYRVAERCELKVTLVANAWLQVPNRDWIEFVLSDRERDAADDWIAEHVGEDDIVITEDIPLASRCLKRNARVLSPRGRVFDESSIGEALASRELMSQLRELGSITGGPAPMQRQDRSTFLQRFDEIIQKVRRNHRN